VAEAAPVTDSCGCERPPRRLCDICYSTERVFLACSAECLGNHQRALHPEQAALSAETRARRFAAGVNGRFPENWQRYASHRQRLMQLVEMAGTGGRLAVFGAGNASDLELDWLAERFDAVHLIDLDGQALERAKARHALKHPERLFLHGDMDLSGLLHHLDDWAESFPEPRELARAALEATGELTRKLGSFDVTLSTCVLSQLGLPFRRAWVTSRTGWSQLTSALHSVHLGTLIGTTLRAGILACDVQTTQRAPALDRFREQSGRELLAFVRAQVEAGALALHPDPRSLQGWFQAPGLAQVVAQARIVEPWLWDLGEVRQLVYGLVFQRATRAASC
jgi:hypothetical protein